VVLNGLTAQDRIYLSIPSGMEDEKISLLKEMEGKRKKNLPDEENKEASNTPVPVSASGN